MISSFILLGKGKDDETFKNQTFKASRIESINFMEQKKTTFKISFIDEETFVYETLEGDEKECTYKVPGKYKLINNNKLVLNLANNETWIAHYNKKDPNRIFLKEKNMYFFNENPVFKNKLRKKEKYQELYRKEPACPTF